ncbi:MAG: phenylalanine--tRNA ligase subunit beta [Verrucomicrobium sp.]|nr:phenylalanine--tRNA ligase subunit beta [Verrucomicrobium sp.]
MKFSLRWLQDYIEIALPVDALAERLTQGGTEVEGIEKHGVDDPNLVVGEVLSFVQHPNADRLRLCKVSTGTEERQIVCGAKNFNVGDRVPLALPGARLPGDFVIKESKLRGELSQGMMCSAKELNLAEDAEGLFILPAGTPFGPFSAVCPPDTFIDVEVTPNRPDLLSYRGLARELAALGCGTLKAPPAAPALSWPQEASGWAVALEDEGCPLYSVTVLEGVKVGPSPAWLQEKIAATGHRPINNVVDITNFVLWEMGQPLHAFDAAKLSGKKIAVRSARAGEILAALDDQTYALAAGDLVIADEAKPHALAGVIGGKESGVSDATTTVALEAAWFVPGRVRASGRRLGILTDAAYRYERRVDPAGVFAARDRAIALLQELCGARIAGASVVAGNPPAGRVPITLRAERLDRVLGAPVAAAETERLLGSLGVEKRAEGWQPPSFRHDLEAEIDLIEEVARLRGLADLPGRVSLGWVPESEADRVHDKAARLRAALAARGWQECLTEAMGEAAHYADAPEALEVANPINAQFTHLRPNLREGLLAVAARNVAKGNASLRLFELGRVYVRREGKIVEETRLGLLCLGAEPATWTARERAADFYDLKGIGDFLEAEAGLGDATRLERGPVPTAAAKRHDLKAKAFYAEYHAEGWLRHAEAPRLFQGLPTFPAVRRDVAVVVKRDVPQEAVRRAILDASSAAGALEDLRLFDVFEDAKGEKIAADKKSLAYALTYRLKDRTLTDKEVNGWQETLRASLRGALGCEFRE